MKLNRTFLRKAAPSAVGLMLLLASTLAVAAGWWLAAIPTALAGLAIPGIKELAGLMWTGYADLLESTSDSDAVE